MEFVKSAKLPEKPTAAAYYFIFNKGRILINSDAENLHQMIPFLEAGNIPGEIASPCYIGQLEEFSCFSAGASQDFEIPGFTFHNLRAMFVKLDQHFFGVAGYARQIYEWRKDHQYCGRCAGKNVIAQGEHVMHCRSCDLSVYPRVSPAIITAVLKEDQILLARGIDFPNKQMFSVLAGFVEPGETLEECVEREVFEETGIGISDIRYFSSQPWPFPHSLMIGFTARYRSGDIVIGADEIAEADWFRADALPLVPGKPSLAGDLIQWFRDQCG